MSGKPRVIKANQVQGVQPAPYNTTDTDAALRGRLAEAHQEIEAHKERVLAELAEVRGSAYREGYDAGHAEGLAKGDAEARAAHHEAIRAELERRTAPLNQSLAELLVRLGESADHWRAQWERLGIQLACAIAERLARQNVPEPGQLVRRSLAEAIALIGRCPRLSIRLHPADAESLELDKAALDILTRGVGEARIVADESLPPGSCRLESDFGSIDAGLQTQLERIQQELTG